MCVCVCVTVCVCVYLCEVEDSISRNLFQCVSCTSEAIDLLVRVSYKYLSTRLTSDERYDGWRLGGREGGR